jgi:hypothetical protein
MTLDHHHTTFRLLRREPVLSRPAVRRLAALERALRVELPVALREWYSLEGAVQLLDLNDDLLHFEPLTIEENAARLKKSLEKGWPLSWMIGRYSSGVCFSAAFPTGPDPVVRCVETDGSFLDDADEWCDRPFSAFVFGCCWHRLKEGAAAVSGVEPCFEPPHLDMLMESFDAGPHVLRGDAPRERSNPITGQGGMPVTRFQFFFFGREGMIHLWSREDPRVSTTEVRWEVSCADEPGVQALASGLRSRGIIW